MGRIDKYEYVTPDATEKAMRATSEAIAKLGSPVAPSCLPPIVCAYCGGPVGADEEACSECGAKAVPPPFRYDVTDAALFGGARGGGKTDTLRARIEKPEKP